jgi:hypothetical protein
VARSLDFAAVLAVARTAAALGMTLRWIFIDGKWPGGDNDGMVEI